MPAGVEDRVELPMALAGVSAGAASSEGCPDLGSLACVLADASNASYSSTRIACTVPPGVGSGFKVGPLALWSIKEGAECKGCLLCTWAQRRPLGMPLLSPSDM